MLPPVRATLSSFVEYQTPQQQPMLRQTPTPANASANAGASASMPISGGRLDILSLSAQLQLAQGFSIFAETIGKLVKLPRREGEALLDYARRLMEAVKAMSPAQQASLERMMNQLVKGITLRLLTEILNNPTGPDAARLAVRLETAQLLERDLAAKAVVSSYRQNGAAEPAATPAAAPRPTMAAPVAANAAAAPESAETASAPQVEAAVSEEAPALVTEDGAPDTKAPAMATTDAKAQGVAGQPAAETSPQMIDVEAQTVQGAPDETAPAGTASGSGAEETMVAEAETAETFASVVEDLPQNHAARASMDDADIWGPASSLLRERRASAGGVYDGPALARLSQRGLEEQPARQSTNTRMGMPAMAEWLSEVFAEGNTDLLEPLPAAAKIPPEQQVIEEHMDKEAIVQNKVQSDDAGKAMLHRPAYTPEEPEAPAPQARPNSTSANGGSQPAHINDTAEQLVLPMPMPIIPREGVALPYVAYPPEERERDPEERKTKAIAPTDEDGEQQHGAGDQQFAEDHPHEETSEDEGAEAGEEKDEDQSRANDLYWRMAGWN